MVQLILQMHHYPGQELGMINRMLAITMVLAVLVCCIGIVIGDPFIYLVSYKVFFVTGFLCITLLLANIAWRLASRPVKKKYEGRRNVFERD